MYNKCLCDVLHYYKNVIGRTYVHVIGTRDQVQEQLCTWENTYLIAVATICEARDITFLAGPIKKNLNLP